MVKIIGDSSTGKTGRLFLLAVENNGIIVCKEPSIMKDKAYRYGSVGVDFISYYDFNPLYRYNRPIFIDELDLYLQHFNKDIQGYTISED